MYNHEACTGDTTVMIETVICFINPRRACAARVAVLVCVSVRGPIRYVYGTRYSAARQLFFSTTQTACATFITPRVLHLCFSLCSIVDAHSE